MVGVESLDEPALFAPDQKRQVHPTKVPLSHPPPDSVRLRKGLPHPRGEVPDRLIIECKTLLASPSEDACIAVIPNYPETMSAVLARSRIEGELLDQLYILCGAVVDPFQVGLVCRGGRRRAPC